MNKTAEEIAQEYLKENGDDLVHGLHHFKRMMENFEILKKDNRGESPILKSLEFAVWFHDLGKREEVVDFKHGLISKNILEKKYKEFFDGFDQKIFDYVKFSVEGHTDEKSIQECFYKSDEDKYICLVLMLALDNMDAVGKVGFYRDLRDFKDKSGNEKIDQKKFLKRLLKNYDRISGNIFRLENIKKEKINAWGLLDKYKELINQSRDSISDIAKIDDISDKDIENELRRN